MQSHCVYPPYMLRGLNIKQEAKVENVRLFLMVTAGAEPGSGSAGCCLGSWTETQTHKSLPAVRQGTEGWRSHRRREHLPSA